MVSLVGNITVNVVHSLFLKFLRWYFHVTHSELFINPLCQKVKTLEVEKGILQQPFVFLEIDYKIFLMQPPAYILINFWSKMSNEPSLCIC